MLLRYTSLLRANRVTTLVREALLNAANSEKLLI
jgi:hypothetical protein